MSGLTGEDEAKSLSCCSLQHRPCGAQPAQGHVLRGGLSTAGAVFLVPPAAMGERGSVCQKIVIKNKEKKQ